MRTSIERATFTGATASLLLASALLTPADAQNRSAEPFAWEGRLATGATLEIKGVNGPIRAVAASGATARVQAIRTARRSDPSQVEIVVVEHADGVTICAVYPSSVLRRNECRPGDEGNLSSNNNDVQVAFTVEVPAGLAFTGRTSNGPVTAERLTGRVAAYTTNGDIRIDGSAAALARTTNGSVNVRSEGDADARTTNGSISAAMGRLSGNPLSFRTTNGTITLRLPGDANAAIEARTSNGRIDSDLPLVLGSSGRNRLSGRIGNGGPTIDLRTTNGRIRLERG